MDIAGCAVLVTGAASGLGAATARRFAADAASKGAVHAMTISAARDLAQIGVRVCTIAPGTVDTPMLAAMTPGFKAALGESVPFPRRIGTVDEFARLAAFIVEHDYLNGETIRMDGAIRMPPR